MLRFGVENFSTSNTHTIESAMYNHFCINIKWENSIYCLLEKGLFVKWFFELGVQVNKPNYKKLSNRRYMSREKFVICIYCNIQPPPIIVNHVLYTFNHLLLQCNHTLNVCFFSFFFLEIIFWKKIRKYNKSNRLLEYILEYFIHWN